MKKQFDFVHGYSYNTMVTQTEIIRNNTFYLHKTSYLHLACYITVWQNSKKYIHSTIMASSHFNVRMKLQMQKVVSNFEVRWLLVSIELQKWNEKHWSAGTLTRDWARAFLLIEFTLDWQRKGICTVTLYYCIWTDMGLFKLYHLSSPQKCTHCSW